MTKPIKFAYDRIELEIGVLTFVDIDIWIKIESNFFLEITKVHVATSCHNNECVELL